VGTAKGATAGLDISGKVPEGGRFRPPSFVFLELEKECMLL